MPEIRLSSVLLPLPDLPSRHTNSPRVELAVQFVEHDARNACLGIALGEPFQADQHRA